MENKKIQPFMDASEDKVRIMPPTTIPTIAIKNVIMGSFLDDLTNFHDIIPAKNQSITKGRAAINHKSIDTPEIYQCIQ